MYGVWGWGVVTVTVLSWRSWNLLASFYTFTMYNAFGGQRRYVKQNCNTTEYTLNILSRPDLQPWRRNTKLYFTFSLYILPTVTDGIRYILYIYIYIYYIQNKKIFRTNEIYLKISVNLLKPTGNVMHQQFNIQQLCVLPILYLCVLYLSENKQSLLPIA